jgi:hypothetical protein
MVMSEGTKLWLLGDIISWPDSLGGGMISLGDVVLCLGVFYGVQSIMLRVGL